jgi:oligopeptide transport system substrate-binding protein
MINLRWPLAVVLAVAATLVPGACGGNGGADGRASDAQILRINLGAEPPSLDPALSGDTTSGSVVLQLSDPLIKLDADFQPVANLAESWDVIDGGRRIVFHLRSDGKWTNGDSVTAEDFEWSWKRVIAPDTAAENAYQFFGIVGAFEYNACDPKQRSCDGLRERVAIRALGERTLEVELTSPQPWFLQQVALTYFAAVHRATVERFGDKWTEPANIVTNGPFRLTEWKHDASLMLRRWDKWRDAASVKLERVDARIISDAATALRAFEAGEIDACFETTCIPPAEAEQLKESKEYAKTPALATRYLGFNVSTVTDPEQRRAMALAIDRRAIVENITAHETPATSFTPKGMPGFDQIAQDFLSEEAELERAREHLAKAKTVKRRINLFFPTRPGARDIAVAAQADWKKLGLEVEVRGMEWAQYLEFIGPPPSKELDVHLVIWLADYADAINFLELWTCKPGNTSAYCDREYDAVIRGARRTPENHARYALYEQAESNLTGPSGAMPIVPLSWPTFPSLRKAYVVGWPSQYDFTKVSIAEEE